MKKDNSITKVLPVLFGFFIMGFVDVVRNVPTRLLGCWLWELPVGQLLPLLMGIVSDSLGQTAGMALLLAAFLYLLFNAFKMEKS